MKIALIGTGSVGQTIASRLVSLGHDVMMGTRNVADKLASTSKDMYGNPPFSEWHAANKNVQLGTFAEAASFGEIILNVTHGGNSINALKLAEAKNLDGKTIIDIANPLDFSKGMPPSLIPELSNTNSLGEEIQKLLPKANVGKRLNIVNCEVMVDARKSGGDPTMFVSGNSAEAKAEVMEILKQFNWNDIIDLGDITTARGTEMLLPIWLRTWMATGNGHFAFKIVR